MILDFVSNEERAMLEALRRIRPDVREALLQIVEQLNEIEASQTPSEFE